MILYNFYYFSFIVTIPIYILTNFIAKYFIMKDTIPKSISK